MSELEFEDYNPKEPKIETSVNPQFVLELAAAIESPDAVCARYEVSKREYEKLQKQKYFRELLAQTTIEITSSGQLLALRKNFYLMHGLQKIHQIMTTTEDEEVALKAWDRIIEFERPKGSAKSKSPVEGRPTTFTLQAEDPASFDTSDADSLDTSGLPFDETPDDYNFDE